MKIIPTSLPHLQAATMKSLLAGFALALATSASGQAAYTAVDLSAAGSFDSASSVNAGQVGGLVSPLSFFTPSHAAFWTGAGFRDLHPQALLGDAATSRSEITGVFGNLQVGWGAGSVTTNRQVAMVWRGTAGSAKILALPSASYSAVAFATDGVQIAGCLGTLAAGGASLGTYHAMVWNASTGLATDLGDGGGKGAQARGVGGGKQVGYALRTDYNAALWSGTSKSLVILQPTGASSSMANATDGTRQVGTATYELRIRAEANKGNNTGFFTYATVWKGTAASAVNIHPSTAYQHSYATGVAGGYICGYAGVTASLSTPAYYHALVWNAALAATDLNAFLPAPFTGAQAFGVDAQGRVAGVMIAADGTRHAVLWIPKP